MLNPIEINFKLDKAIKRALTTELMIKSHDINVIEFHISFDGLELTADHTVKVLSVFNDTKSQTNVNCDIVDGKAIYRPDTSIISQYEHVLNYVYVYHGDQSLDVRSFTYSVGLSQIDKTALKVKTVYDQSYAELLTEFEARLQDYKDSLPQASDLRAEVDVILDKFKTDSRAKLDVIEAAEEIRQTAESSRQEAEAERKEAEAERKEAELLREENYNQKVDTAIVEADVVAKVDNKVTELTPQINDLTAQLAQTELKKADRTYVDTQFSKIGNASPSGAFPTLQQLEEAYPTGNKNIYVVSKDNSWYYWNDTAWTLGGLYNATTSDEFMAVNIVPNSEISSVEPWVVNPGRPENVSVSGGELTYHIDKPLSSAYIGNSSSVVMAGDLYYVGIELLPKYVTTTRLRLGGSNGRHLRTTLIKNEWNIISDVIKATSVSGFYVYHDTSTGYVSGDTIKVRRPIAINLTKTFGKGNEPTKVEMENLLTKYPNSWFKDVASRLVDTRELYVNSKENFEATNEIYNGDFTTIRGWETSHDGMEHLSALNNELTYSVQTLIAGSYITSNPLIRAVIGHKYYIRMDICPKYKNDTAIGFGGVLASGYGLSLVPDVFNKISASITAETSGSLFLYHRTSENYKVGETISYRKAMVIDLTKTFGEGNEPTLDEVEEILEKFPRGWFEGISSPFIGEKELYFKIKENKIKVLNEDPVNPPVGTLWLLESDS